MSNLPSQRVMDFNSAVLRDGWFLAVAESTNDTAIAFTPFRTKAAVDTLLATSRGTHLGITAANGIIEMGPSDAVELLILGTDADAETANIHIEGLTPGYDHNDPQTIVNYGTTPICTLAAVLGALTAGAAGAAMAGVDTGDLVAKDITPTSGTSPVGLEPVLVNDPGTMAIARVMACGCPILYIQVDRGTCASIIVLARRCHNYLGGAQRSN